MVIWGQRYKKNLIMMLFYWKNCNFAPMEAKQINKMIKRLLVALLILMGQQTVFAVMNPSDTT
jgi:hypothetical protein